VDISRTGYTGDLGYELWIPWDDATKVWDALMEQGRAFDIHPAGMLALDVARIEAGLILIEVDYFSSKKALIPSQKYSPYEIGLGRLVNLEKDPFVGQKALREKNAHGPARTLVGLEINWDDIERLYDAVGLAPQIPGAASRAPVPVYQGKTQVGKATSTTWSPTLKKMIALASVATPKSAVGTHMDVELTVEAMRHRVRAATVNLPFYNPPRKMATPAG
jgi:aminomethyltransferase